MLPEFPRFEPLRLNHQPHLETLSSRFAPFSDFNFTSLYSWNTSDAVAVSGLHGNVVVRFSDYLTGEPFYSFHGDKRANETAHALLSLMKEEGRTPEIKLLPAPSAATVGNDRLRVVEDADNFDYILSVDRLKTYEGSRLKPNRNLVTRFKKTHQAETRILDLADPKIQQTLKAFFLTWVENKRLPFSQAENEFKAMSRVFDLLPNDRLVGIGIYVDGTLAGFTISERLPGPYGMVHFEKANPWAFVGVYQYLMQETARIMGESGCEFLNYQQDLGLPGLRTCKTGFFPCDYLRKYRIVWNEKE